MRSSESAAPRVIFVADMPFSVKPETAIRLLISNMARYIDHETIALTDTGTSKLEIPTPKTAHDSTRRIGFNDGDPGFLHTCSVLRLLVTGDGRAA